MSLYDELINIYPQLAEDENILRHQIVLRDDSDGQGAYIEKWDYDLPIPSGYKLGK